MSQTTDPFKQEAENLFNIIHPLWTGAYNVWRTACAMDTLLDYFAVCEVDPSPYKTDALNALDPTQLGNWWDDFGWIGIVALRAAEQNIFQESSNDFLKIAINSWAYMYGPNWSKSNTAIYPFTDDSLPGWKQFAKDHEGRPNFGAPNVWDNIAQTWTDKPISKADQAKRRPRYSPGGAWNSVITDTKSPLLSETYSGEDNNLAPMQNTVTNGLYTILTLRIYQASQNPIFKDVFVESTLDTDACWLAWTNQIDWFNQWMLKTTPVDQSLLMGLGDTSSALVRERVSTFDEWNNVMYWDAAYRKNLAWTGDQGLLLGVLREGQATGYKSHVLGFYPEIVSGVFKEGYHPRTYGSSITGDFLVPWMEIGADDPFNVLSPGGDDSDYQTGNGIFMRYLLQAYNADSSLVQPYKDYIINTANNIIKSGFGTKANPDGKCDAYTPMTNSNANEISAYINRLSELLLAIKMSD